MLKLRLLLLIFVLMFSLVSLCYAERGVVAYMDSGKDIIVIQTDPDYFEQYTCANIMTYLYDYPQIGDYVYGDLTTFASQELYNPRTDKSFTVWIDQYWLSKEDAIEWINNHY